MRVPDPRRTNEWQCADHVFGFECHRVVVRLYQRLLLHWYGLIGMPSCCHPPCFNLFTSGLITIIQVTPAHSSCTPLLRAGHGGQSDACPYSLCDTRLVLRPFDEAALTTNLPFHPTTIISSPTHHTSTMLSCERPVARSASTAKAVGAPRPAHAQPVSDWVSAVH